ncbi:MAG: arginine--tRNA ligase [Gammaproteobacteria bacterium]|nr:arginine--tRNA ligase [Gammaproteobacteria bacterium]
MKQRVENLLRQAIKAMVDSGELTALPDTPIQVDRTRDSRHGDFSSNYALTVAANIGSRPRDLAQSIATRVPSSPMLDRVEVAGPGFINFFLARNSYQALIPEIISAGARYGSGDAGQGVSVLLEFVSANPTGPLHIGHGRGAAYGAALARLLAAAGFQVTREYYVNDRGRQMDILTVSIWLRYLELCGQEFTFPEQAYRGDYVRPIAEKLHADSGREFEISAAGLFDGFPRQVGPDAQLDWLIARSRSSLGGDRFERVWKAGLDDILGDIRDDLREFGVEFDNWYSEKGLIASGRVDDCIRKLKESGHLYEKDGALWLQSSRFGDEKDRVVVRENGQTTYFAPDIAYHLDKFDRGFQRAINIWGADHHGYIPRMKAALEALGRDPEALTVLLVQFATLYRGRQKVQMSTRSGEFVTLRELREEVGNDAARFFYVTRKSEQHLDFDLELAKSRSNENPVYYIQYAHARICSVFAQLRERGLDYDPDGAMQNTHRLEEPREQALLATLSRYPEVILAAALAYEPHQIGFYLREVANDFHVYYNAHQILVEDGALRNARLGLIVCVRQVLQNGLGILGVTAPVEM